MPVTSTAVAYRIEETPSLPVGARVIVSCPKGYDTKYAIIINDHTNDHTPGNAAKTYKEMLLRQMTNSCPSHPAMLTLPQTN
jgi:hypothetical protein